jgi:hypothetical protein
MSTIPFGSKVAVWLVLVTVGLPVGTKTPCWTVTVACVPPMVLVAPPLLNVPPDALVVLPPAVPPGALVVLPPPVPPSALAVLAPPVPPDALVVAPPAMPPNALVVLTPAVPPDALVVLPPVVPPTLPPRPDGAPPLPLLFLSGARVQATNDTAAAIANHPRRCFMPNRLSDHPSPSHGLPSVVTSTLTNPRKVRNA